MIMPRPLGWAGVQVSDLGLGTMNFAGRCDEDEASRILDMAVENGITMTDTAVVPVVPTTKTSTSPGGWGPVPSLPG